MWKLSLVVCKPVMSFKTWSCYLEHHLSKYFTVLDISQDLEII